MNIKSPTAAGVPSTNPLLSGTPPAPSSTLPAAGSDQPADQFVTPNRAPVSLGAAPAPIQASVADVLAGHLSLAPGSQGDAVKTVQGILHVQQTGVLGPTTAAAIVAFKKLQDLSTPAGLDPATVGPTTMKALIAAKGALPADISDSAKTQMAGLLKIAKNDASSDDSAAWGKCYGAVWGYMMKAQAGAGYGSSSLATSAVPSSFAAQFGEWMNTGNNAASVGMKRLAITNPYDAPPGAIVVVGAGSPGTSSHDSHSVSYATNNGVSAADWASHPNWPGDISVATGDGVNFVNDHTDETYGGSRAAWAAAANKGTAKLIGVYVPE